MRLRRVESEAEWCAAADLKRGRAYRDVMSVTGWTWEEVAKRYESVWGTGPGDFHRRMLENAADGGELLGWFEGDRMVAYAAIRTAPLCSSDGPLVCCCDDILVDPQLSIGEKRQIVKDLIAALGETESISEQAACDPGMFETFLEEGFRLSKATVRLLR